MLLDNNSYNGVENNMYFIHKLYNTYIIINYYIFVIIKMVKLFHSSELLKLVIYL